MTTSDRDLLDWSPEAVVFDCDGTLMDSERHWQEARSRAFREHGLQPPPGFAEQALGLHYEDCGRLMAQAVHKPDLAEDLTAALLDHFLALVTGEPVTMPGAVRLVRLLSGRLPLAVASNCPRVVVEGSLERAGLLAHFQCLVVPDTGDCVRPKPYPDVYAVAARLCGVPRTGRWRWRTPWPVWKRPVGQACGSWASVLGHRATVPPGPTRGYRHWTLPNCWPGPTRSAACGGHDSFDSPPRSGNWRLMTPAASSACTTGPAGTRTPQRRPGPAAPDRPWLRNHAERVPHPGRRRGHRQPCRRECRLDRRRTVKTQARTPSAQAIRRAPHRDIVTCASSLCLTES